MKEFKVVVNDSDEGKYYEVWNFVPGNDPIQYRYAGFYGKHAKRFAYQHCRFLNSLDEEDKP